MFIQLLCHFAWSTVLISFVTNVVLPLRESQSPIRVFRKDGIGTVRYSNVYKSGPPDTSDEPVRVRCGWSNCDFIMKVYPIPPVTNTENVQDGNNRLTTSV